MRAWSIGFLGGLWAVGCAPTVIDSGTGSGTPAPAPPVMQQPVAPPPPADAGTVAPTPAMPPPGSDDACGDGLDGDLDGSIDEACPCSPGALQPCYVGAAATAGIGACIRGMQTCVASGEFGGEWGACEGSVAPAVEECGNGIDENCDGMVDEGCAMEIMLDINLDGDCVTTSCPPEAPYPVACNIQMDGNDPRGCVGSSPMSSVVYFQEGDACGAGRVRGSMTCSTTPGVGLTEANCVINKSTRFYPADRSGCPDTSG